ncbi:MAG TPA: hypothetical protein VFF84_08345 [Sphingobium sp.]|nr:hypothetical protein [Sphingobium sp.]
MRAEVASLYAEHRAEATPRFDLECAFFLHWCTEIGLRNAPASAIDRWWARLQFESSVRHMRRHLPPMAAVLADDPVASYRQRYREALARIRNIYVRRVRNGGLEMPLTPRLSLLFLRYTADLTVPPPAALADETHRLLTAICERHVIQLMTGKDEGTLH